MKRAPVELWTLALAVSGDEPPTAFRIFRHGVNPTRKGPVLFDDAAARAVMSDYAAHGADVMVDLEHLSLDDKAPNYDPDARAWFGLELRTTADGPELWAVNVRWTADGEARLREKRQRYISPAFRREKKSGRVIDLFNVALVATPATDQLQPLVAASAQAGKDTTMNAMLLAALGLAADADEKAAADAMAEALKDPLKMIALLDALLASDAADDSAEKPAAKPGAAPADGAEKTATKKASPELAAELAAEVIALRADLNQRTVRDLIASNRSKLSTPALERWALSQTPAALEMFLSAAPAAPAPKPVKEGPRATGAAVELTAEERHLCKLTGRSEAELLKHKTEEIAASAAEEN